MFLGRVLMQSDFLLLYVPLHKGFWQEAVFVLDTLVPVTGTTVPGRAWAADEVL